MAVTSASFQNEEPIGFGMLPQTLFSRHSYSQMFRRGWNTRTFCIKCSNGTALFSENEKQKWFFPRMILRRKHFKRILIAWNNGWRALACSGGSRMPAPTFKTHWHEGSDDRCRTNRQGRHPVSEG